MNERNPLLRTLTYIVLIAVVVLVYSYGWSVTDINLEVPQEPRRQEQAMRALRGILTPDLVERDEAEMEAYANFMVGCGQGEPPSNEPGDQGQSISVTPVCGVKGDRITVEGTGFRPNSEGFLYWIKPNGTERPVAAVETDANGDFIGDFQMPDSDEDPNPYLVRGKVVWPVGRPRPSEAVKQTVEKMIETVFLALMATTLAVPIAGVLSFIAAGNLMRQVTTSSAGFLAGIIVVPIGWVVGEVALGFIGDWGVTAGRIAWPSLIALALLGVGVYAVMAGRVPRVGASAGGAQEVVRSLVSILTAAVVWLYLGLLTGAAFWLSVLLQDVGVIGTLVANMIGTMAELMRLLLPGLGGIVGSIFVFRIGSRVSEATVGRLHGAAGHLVGLALGALSGGIVLAGIGILAARFYQLPDFEAFRNTMAMIGAGIGGLVGAFLGTDRPFPLGMVLYYSSRTVLNGVRAIEPLIMAIVFSIWVSIGPFAGVLALTLHSIAALGKLYSEQVENIDPGPIEAIQATGANQLQTIVYGVVPQIIPPYIAFTIYRWDINVRLSTIIGFVGGGGIGFILQQWINLLRYRQAGVAMLAIAIVVAALDFGSARLREKIV